MGLIERQWKEIHEPVMSDRSKVALLVALLITLGCVTSVGYYQGGDVRGFDVQYPIGGYSCGIDVTPGVHPYCTHP